MGSFYEKFVLKCEHVPSLRVGSSTYIQATAGKNIKSDPTSSLLKAVTQMSSVDKAQREAMAGQGSESSMNKPDPSSLEGLPTELLKYVREATTPEASILLAQMESVETSAALVKKHGRDTWYHTHLYISISLSIYIL